MLNKTLKGLVIDKVECDMKHSDEAIKMVKTFGYNEEEAVNILDGKNPDGTEFTELPF